jgi:ABC-2 type transport system ATP-binding protein
MANAAVETRELVKRFGGLTAVDRVSLSVQQGEVFGFLGPNGAGKTTVIRMLCGIIAPTSGSARILGFEVPRDNVRVRAHIGYMSQRFSLYDDLSAAENLAFFGSVYGLARAALGPGIELALGRFDLGPLRDALAREMPTGARQRLALACALLHDPGVLFLDEPTSGMDPASRRGFWDLVHGLAGQGKAVLVTTHYMDEAEYCDRLALIYRGELIADGTPETLKTTLMKEHVLEVLCDRAEAAMGVIERLEEVKEVALFGRGLHVVAEDSRRADSAIRELLCARGHGIERIERIIPSLEDVFVSLIEARDRAEEPQVEVQR